MWASALTYDAVCQGVADAKRTPKFSAKKPVVKSAKTTKVAKPKAKKASKQELAEPIRTQRDETKQRTKEALIKAGVKLFAEHGFDQPSLDAICEKAGFTRGAFYVHFKDRDDFLVEVMQYVGASVVSGLIPDNTDLPAIITRFIQAVSSGEYPLTRKKGVRPHQLIEACARSKTIRTTYVSLVTESIHRLTAAIEQSQQHQTIRNDIAAEPTAALLLAVVIGAQTMIDLQAPIDFGASALSLMQLLQPPRTDT